MAVSDVIPQDGGPGNVKLHPYLITLVRWCVSCLWSTATVFLHRLMTTPLPQITASKPPPRATLKPRQASTDHLHPEPRVECVVLHTPDTPTLDVIFVHGLYGSLGNTWRQGEWRTKYKLDPTKVPLRNHTKEPCNCIQNKPDNIYNNIQEIYSYEAELNETKLNERLNGCFKKILPNENSLITEKFYNNTLIEVEVNNFETQAKFVTELFKNCDKNCDIDTFKCNCENRETKCDLNEKLNECRCKLNVSGVKCRAGCGCVCDECYSPCWPKDWIKEDFPGARVISINYTSDPYLWRPLWVKGNKRLRLHERADQMMEQLLQLGVGQRPIIWVGHSKGGLFIKQIYCEAYEAYLKMDKSRKAETTKTIANNNFEDQSNRQYNKNNVINNIDNNYNRCNDNEIVHIRNNNQNELFNNFVNNHSNGYTANGGTSLRNIDEMNQIRNNDNSGNEFDENTDFLDISIRNDEKLRIIEENINEVKNEVDFGSLSSNHEEDSSALSLRASLWRASSGFMFYSVPHRGSPLADIKTPITSRSVELQEIAKDCPLVLALQDRWLVATQTSRPLVRSLVETCKTLMSVLWLRIVSEDSADAGVGSLHGVSVDHREICKPSSRTCLLYTELTELIQGALSKCDCQ